MDWWRTSESSLARWLRAAHDALLGEMPILAAGTALYAIIAAVPTLAAVVAVLGLVTDPHQIHDHLNGLQTVLPQEVVDFLADQLERQSSRSSGELGLQLATSLVLALISARSSARALVDALNRAYRVREVRGVLHRLWLTFALAAGTLVALTVLFAVVVALPGIVAMVGLKGYGIVRWLRWPVLLALTFATLLALYRVAPSPRPLGSGRRIWPGAAIATVLLVLVSWMLSEWVERVANYEVFYGAFGSIVVVVLWFYLATIALVAGGFVNAEIEREAGAPAPDRSMY
ncbi:MAG TPA: YihY/virulence factor BrkB family protein [Kofleriaceae bacterium]|nr:YihY/virulence factor BrkB family protein [Kofleriaceae bacterium]